MGKREVFSDKKTRDLHDQLDGLCAPTVLYRLDSDQHIC